MSRNPTPKTSSNIPAVRGASAPVYCGTGEIQCPATLAVSRGDVSTSPRPGPIRTKLKLTPSKIPPSGKVISKVSIRSGGASSGQLSPQPAAISASQPTAKRTPSKPGRSPAQTISSGPKPATETALQKFDRSVDEELSRRRDPANVLVEATTSDANVLIAVDHLVRAEAAYTFAGTVHAAELAAASAPPERAEEAAIEGAKSFQAKIIDVVHEDVPGLKPIQVIGYVGITRPTRPAR